MDNQNQQIQVSDNVEHHGDQQPASTVEEFLHFLEPASKMYQLSKGQMADKPKIAQASLGHESDVPSQQPFSPMHQNEALEDLGNDSIESWIGGGVVAPYSPFLPWLQGLSFAEVHDFLTKYNEYERKFVLEKEEIQAMIPMRDLVSDRVLDKITQEYWAEQPLRPLPPAVLTQLTKEYWAKQTQRPLPQNGLLCALQRINDDAHDEIIAESFPQAEAKAVEDDRPASPSSAMYCQEGGGPRSSPEGYALKARRERREHKTLRAGMFYNPYGKIFQPFHPYQKKGAV